MSELPGHIQSIVDTIAAERRRHEQSAGPIRRMSARATRTAARPGFQATLALLAIAWLGWNQLAPLLGGTAFDGPPFDGLANLATGLALFTTLLIVTTQRHENELAERRAELALQLAILGEQRSAKLVQMLDDLRRDMPTIEHRPDPEAIALAQSADAEAVLDAIRESALDEPSVEQPPS